MAGTGFTVKGNNVGRIRLEPTEIIGTGSSANPQLILPFKFQLQPFGPTGYVLLRMNAKIFVGNDHHPVAIAEHSPMAEYSMPNGYDRPLNLIVPLTFGQIKHIEDIRSGNDLPLRVSLTGLVILKQPSEEYEQLQEMNLLLSVPRSHWIDTALRAWGVSDLRLLEIKFPGDSRKEMATARARLEKAEELYRVGDYSHVLTELRSAFDAIAQTYGTGVDKATWEKLLTHTHAGVRDKLLDLFAAFRQILHLGPHQPMPTAQTPIPVSRQDARLSLVLAHAIFEYFSAENWPGI